MYNERITLISPGEETISASGVPVQTEQRYECFAQLRSIGMREFYQSQSTGDKPELKFVLPDYLDYQGEQALEHEGIRYKVLRTYRGTGHELEITVYGGVHIERT